MTPRPADVIDGGPDGETLNGSTGDDVIHGHGGGDLVYGHGGSDQLFGDEGSDFLIVGDTFSSVPQPGEVDDPSRLDGGSDDDTLYGGSAADTLIGGSGSDFLLGNGGNDVLDGGDGYDVAAFRLNQQSLSAGVVIDASAVSSDSTVSLADGLGGTDTLSHIEAVSIIGTQLADQLIGSAGADSLLGAGGADVIDGGAGDDFIAGGLGRVNDAYAPPQDAGGNQLSGGEGADIIYSGGPGDTLDGGAGDDQLLIQFGGGSASGGEGADFLQAYGRYYGDGLEHGVTLDGGAGNDQLIGADYADHLLGGDGDDDLEGGDGDDDIDGGPGFDSVTLGGLGADTRVDLTTGDAVSREGHDHLSSIEHLILTNGGTVIGTEAAEVFEVLGHGVGAIDFTPAFFQGGGGDDFLVGGAGADTIDGGADDDIVYGSAGADRLDGASGRDQLYGGDGDDVITGGGGGDSLTGNDGVDTFRYTQFSDSTLTAFDVIQDFQHGTDRIDLSAVSGGFIGLLHNDNGATGVLYGYDGSAFQGALAAVGDVEPGDLQTAAGVQFYIQGSSSGDTLIGGTAGDTILGGDGNDYLVGGGGADVISGGAGADVFAYTPVAADSTPGAPDILGDFQHGVDKVDLSYVAGPAVGIGYDGSGDSFLFYALDASGQAQGLIGVVGDVEPGDLILPVGTTVTQFGAFSGAGPQAIDHPAHVTFAKASEFGHVSLF